ncbi:MAG: lysylphosphatidylglycerol synthase transmembrane domain-containing protein [Patescibacteria group bacterium]
MNKKGLKLFVSFVIGATLIYIWLRLIDVNTMLEYFKHINVYWVIVAVILYVSAYFIRSVRWKIILSPVEKISFKESFTLFMAGMMINYIIPIRAGEVAKSAFLKSTKQTPIAASLPTVFIDKMMDLFPIVILAGLLPFLTIKMNNFLIWMLIALLIVFLIFVGIVWLSLRREKTVTKFLQFWFFWLPQKIKLKINNFLAMFVQGLAVIKINKSSAYRIVFFTLLAIVFDALYIMAMFKAFDFKISFLVALFGYTLINLSYILPTPPAQIGSNEVIYVIIFTLAFGIDKNLVSATLGFAHLLTGSIIFLLGTMSLQSLGLKFSLRGNN